MELCRENAINSDSVIVCKDGVKYHPIAIKIWFTEKGETRNTAMLCDIKANSVVHLDIEEISELTN